MTTTTYTQTRWSLNDHFPAPDSPELQAVFQQIERQAGEFEALRPSLNETLSAGSFLEILDRLEAVHTLARRVDAYASLYFAEDTQNPAALSLLQRSDQFFAELSNRLLFFSLWWKELSDEAAAPYLAVAGERRYWLEEMRHFKPHTLSEAEEKIINIKNVTGVSALNTLYDMLTNRYVFRLKVDGKVQKLTRGELTMYVRHPDGRLRAAAYREMLRVYGQDAPLLGQMYQTLVRDWRNEQVTLRRFRSPIAARNLANDIPDEVVETLLELCRRNAPLFQRFFRLKARWLGMKKLRRYDIYAPVGAAERHVPFEQAAELVLDSFQQFHPQVAKLAERVFAENHLDSEVRKGKRGGAFCLTAVPRLTPWVLTNYQGRIDDVSTLAHELGHAVHSMLAEQHSLFTFHPSLPLAETASTFGEMLLVERLLKEESDPAVRRDLLFGQVDDAYATILRQAYFALFERQAHEMIQQGATADELADAYMDNLREQFGDAVALSDEFRWEWVSIPHIYNVPFYVYAYAFGQLLVLALYDQYRKEGEAFKPRYLQLLAAGGSDSPERILAAAGVDIRQPSFWQGGFDVIAGLIEQLEALPAPR
jgi:oligoendopeptidase F